MLPQNMNQSSQLFTSIIEALGRSTLPSVVTEGKAKSQGLPHKKPQTLFRLSLQCVNCSPIINMQGVKNKVNNVAKVKPPAIVLDNCVHH